MAKKGPTVDEYHGHHSVYKAVSKKGKDMEPKYGLYGGILLILVFTIVSIIRGIIFQHKLYKYLRENHTEKWKYLTTVFGFGPGYANSRRAMIFLFGKDDFGDPEVLRLKVAFRNCIIYMATGLVAVFILLFMLSLIHI